MSVDVLAVIFFTTIIQSIFGVGIILFGTPLLLLLGYDFSYALSIVLPISIAINTFQILKHYTYIDLKLYKNVLLYSVPFVVLFLFVITNIQLNINLIIGLFLIFTALKSFSPRIERTLQVIIRYEKSYLILMGAIHGITSLGGSLLTALVHEKNQPKHNTRVTIAICYSTFAVFQLLTLYFMGYDSGMPYPDIMLLLQVSVVTFLLTDEFLYSRLDNKKYSQIFAIFLAISGSLLFFKSLNV